MKSSSRATALVPLIVFATATLPAQRLSRPVIDTVNHHIVRVTNNGPSAWADTNGWKLVYERTVQPKDGEPGELGDPRAVLLLGDGRVVVADETPVSLNLYDATGHFVRRIGREGSGPSEFRAPLPELFHDTIVVHDPQLSRGTVMTADGKPVRSFTTVCCQFGAPISVDGRGRLRVLANGTGSDGSRGQWVYFDLTGKRLDSLNPPRAVKPLVWEAKSAGASTTFYVPLASQNMYAFLHDGAILYGGTGLYQLLRSGNGRDTNLIVRRTDLVPTPVRSEVRDSLFHRIVDHNERARGIASLSDIPSTYPIWDEVHEDVGANLWVLRSTGPGHPRRFDVFTPGGTFLGEVAVPFAGGYIAAWAHDRIGVLDRDGDERPRIRIYRIDRRGK